MNHQEARERIKIVPTKMLQTAYRGLVRLQDKRLSAGATDHAVAMFAPPAARHCGCILTVAAIQHHNKKKRISAEVFERKLTRYDIYQTILKIDPSMDKKAEDVNCAMFNINDNFRSLVHGKNTPEDQRERYVFVKDVLTAELTARKALPVSKKAVAA